MEEQNKFWRNHVKVFTGLPLAELMEVLNNFYKDNFVIATQTFPYELEGARVYDAIVYYKTKPE